MTAMGPSERSRDSFVYLCRHNHAGQETPVRLLRDRLTAVCAPSRHIAHPGPPRLKKVLERAVLPLLRPILKVSQSGSEEGDEVLTRHDSIRLIMQTHSHVRKA